MVESKDDLSKLEERIARLESALAAYQDDDALADRVINRLTARAAEREHNPSGTLVLAAEIDPPPEPPRGAVLHPPTVSVESGSKSWFFTNLIAELRLMVAMYFDPHYRISRLTQFAVPGLLFLLIFNYFFFSVWVSIAFLSPVVERLLAVLAGIVIYSLLTREVARYKEVLAYLSRYRR